MDFKENQGTRYAAAVGIIIGIIFVYIFVAAVIGHAAKSIRRAYSSSGEKPPVVKRSGNHPRSLAPYKMDAWRYGSELTLIPPARTHRGRERAPKFPCPIAGTFAGAVPIGPVQPRDDLKEKLPVFATVYGARGDKRDMRSMLQRSSHPLDKETGEVANIACQSLRQSKLTLPSLQPQGDTAAQKSLVELQEQIFAQATSLAHMRSQNQRGMVVQRVEDFRRTVRCLSATCLWKTPAKGTEVASTSDYSAIIGTKYGEYVQERISRCRQVWLWRNRTSSTPWSCSRAFSIRFRHYTPQTHLVRLRLGEISRNTGAYDVVSIALERLSTRKVSQASQPPSPTDNITLAERNAFSTSALQCCGDLFDMFCQCPQVCGHGCVCAAKMRRTLRACNKRPSSWCNILHTLSFALSPVYVQFAFSLSAIFFKFALTVPSIPLSLSKAFFLCVVGDLLPVTCFDILLDRAVEGIDMSIYLFEAQ